MAAFTQAESRRLYSWWWDSHISPKNSKWLQENLTDMDVKVKTMIKLIEEDADSFARRAEMYYKKRPELMKLVEEFYRAYRALAERYDHATGALRQAHRTMAEAFPNQIPFSLPDDTPPGSSVSDAEPHTPEMPRPIRALFEPDDLQMEDLGLSSDFHAMKKNGAFSDKSDSMSSKKGLKQLNEMFGSNEKKVSEFAEGRVRKGLNFQVAEEKGSEFKVRNGTSGPQKPELEVQEKGIQYETLDSDERENGDGEISSLREDAISRLSTENQNLKMQILSESENFEKEASDLRKALSKIKDEKEAALLQSQQSLDRYRGALGRISDLETEISFAQEEIKGLNDEILKGVTKSRSFEERSLLLERENQNLHAEIDNLVHKLMTRQEEIQEKHYELEKLEICVQEERLNSMRIEVALQNLQQLHSHSQEEQRVLALELQNGVRILKNTESKNQSLENEILRLKEENNNLNEHNVSSAISLRNLQDELHNLMEKNGKLEEEVGLRVDQRNALQQELYCLKEEINDLERRYRGVKEQIESVGLDPESVQSSVKELRDENLNLKEACRRNGEEKMVLVEKLGNTDKLSEKNKFLENSLSDMSVEIDDLRSKLKNLEESCQILHEDKTTLVTEKSLLVSQVDSIAETLRNLEKTHLELEDRHLCLKREKESTINQIEELGVLLGIQKQEQENLTRSCNAQLTTLQNQIDLLQEEGRLSKQKLEEEEDKLVNVQLESYVLQLCVRDMKQMYELLLIEYQKHIEKSAIVNELVLEMEQKNLRQEMEFNSLLGKHSVSTQINQKLLTGIQELLKLLDMVDDGCADIEDTKIMGKIKDMQIYIMNAQDEKQKLIFENLINATLLEQMRLGILDLIAEKETIEMESVRRKGELLVLESEKHELSETNKQLRWELQDRENREDVLRTEMGFVREQLLNHQESNLTLKNENCKLLEENQSVKKDICYLEEQKFKLEEENNSIITEVSTFANLALIFESSNSEKAMELRRVNGELDHFHVIKNDFENEKRDMMKKMEILETECVHLKESIEKLEGYRNQSMVLLEELNTIRDVCENLNKQIGVEKNLLSHREIEIEQATKNLESKHNETTKLTSDLESFKQELDEVQKIREVLEKQTLVLSEEKINQEKEISSVREEKAKLEFELDKLSEEIENFKQELDEVQKIREVLEKQTFVLSEEKINQEKEISSVHEEKAKLKLELDKLSEEIENFKQELDEVQKIREVLEKQTLVLSEEKINQEKEISSVHEEKAKLELELDKLSEEIENFKQELDEVQKIREVFEKQTLVLSEEKINQEKEISSVHEEKAKLELELDKLTEEIENFKQELDGVQKIRDVLEKQTLVFSEEKINQEKEISSVHEEKAKLELELDKLSEETASVKQDLDEVQKIREVLEKQTLMLSEEKINQEEEISFVHKEKKKLELELDKLSEEIDGFKLREEHLNSELRNWEAAAATLFNDVQTSSIREVLFEEKVCELIGACENLEKNTQMEKEKYRDEIASGNTEIDGLKRKIVMVEGENEAIKAESSAYFPIILSLRGSLTLLEDRALSLTKSHGNGILEPQDAASIGHQNDMSNTHESCEEQSPKIPDVVLELQKLQTKVQAVENAVMELEKLNQLVKDDYMETEEEKSNLDTTGKGVEDLKLQNSSVQEEGQTSKYIIIEPETKDEGLSNDHEAVKTRDEICKGKHGFLTKDIELDPVSDTLCHEKSVGNDLKAEDQMLQLWETAERDCGRESMAEKNIEYHQPEVVEEEKSENPSSELQIEKELGIDNIAGPTIASGTQHKKVIDRLSSNARRLKKLEIIVQELKTKCEKSKKTKPPTGSQYDDATGKLKQVEETISKYVESNSKLIKSAEDGSFKMDENVEKKLEEKENMQKEPYELARKGSVNIGKLELEAQGIQFLLHKLDQEREIKGSVSAQRRSRVLLRDYLYGGKEKMRKKATLCGCMKPSTKGD